MDLAELAQAETSKLHLLHPRTREPLNHKKDGSPVFIELANPDSERYRAAQRTVLDRRVRNSAQQQVAEVENDALEILAAATVSWSLVLEGQAIECSFAAAKALYADSRFGWIRAQVDTHVSSRANFLPQPSAN